MSDIIIQYVVSPVLIAVVGYLLGKLKTADERKRADDARQLARDKADIVLLRKMLKEYYEYYKDKEEINEVDYQNFLEGYEAYHELGGNGMVTKMYNELSKKHISQ